MSQRNLVGQDSPRTNRDRRNTVDNSILNDPTLFTPSLPQEGRTSRLRRWTEECRENNQVLPRNTDPLGQSMHDVALNEEEEDEELDEDWDMVLDHLEAEESEAWYPRLTVMNRMTRYLWSRDDGEDEDRRPEHLVFDDHGMVNIDEEDEEEDDRPDWRDPAWDYNIPFGPRVQYDYTFEQLYPRTARVLDFAQTIPGMRRLVMARDVVSAWAPTVQDNIVRTYSEMAPRALSTAQRTQEVLVASAQAGSHLATEAWAAGQNAVQVIQDTWEVAQPVVRMLRDGRAMRLIVAVPPYDLILRSNGGRRRF
ncbi:hypothetical protein CEP54_002227 [Fusarium duplospermum]|uniref:Uncharacterized protein n=1 Tax=Fusarium duplospermum TaxID=1325734 RepID=A0A428QX55_9HYPO|nr:hypothetical protein CEP54_002227 [Fusarium duplospermum]